jgi:hypothetical protein
MYPKKAQEFLQIAPQFKLGKLLTEAQHPKNAHLSTLVQQDLRQALEFYAKSIWMPWRFC